MWQLEPITQWERDKKWYEKKRPNELAAVLHNLKRYLAQLNAAPNPKAIMAGYLHPRADGRGGGGSARRGRQFAGNTALSLSGRRTEMLYIITIGNKDEQPADIEFCKEFVKNNNTTE